MSKAQSDVSTDVDLMQTAVQWYLSTILSAADCIAKVCPQVGIPYRNRWRRLPQRIGFDVSSRSIEASGRMFQSDLERFSKLAGLYFSQGLQLVEDIGTAGSNTVETAMSETSTHAALLESLADSMLEAGDLDAAPEVREMLELQAEGLRKSARQVRNRLLPSLQRLSSLIQECDRVLKQVAQESILDESTGFVNSRGFHYELKARFEESQSCCVLVIDCSAATSAGAECHDEEFRTIAGEFTVRLSDQFRPSDCIGRIGPRRIAVIFEGDPRVARERSAQIARSISGNYAGGISVRASIQVLEASDADSMLGVLAAIGQFAAAA